MQASVMNVVRYEVESLIEETLREMFAGESVNLWVPKIGEQARKDRDARISSLLSSGNKCSDIAAQEHVSKRHVERIKARTLRQVPP
jgi:hypothetical protein